MTNDELNDALLTLCRVLEDVELKGSLLTAVLMAAEKVADQIRYRAEGSILASRVTE